MRVDRRAPQAERIARQKLGKEPPRGVVWPVQRVGEDGGGGPEGGAARVDVRAGGSSWPVPKATATAASRRSSSW